MNPKSKYLKQYFKDVEFLNDKVILNESTLNSIRANYNNILKIETTPAILKKPFGIFALTDKYLREYSITTFHYIDFRWYSIQMGAKIMHKANIEEWQGEKGYSFNFSRSPMRYSGDVCGTMPGDYRDCFEEIISKERANKLLTEYNIKSPLEKTNKRIKIQCGIGLESLTRIEKMPQGKFVQLGLTFIH